MEFTKTNLEMSKILLVILLIGFTSSAIAQKLEITPYYGYQLNGKIIGYSGDLNIRDASAYGMMLDLKVRPGMQLELFYGRSDTRADFVQFRGPTYKLTDVSVNYFQIGALREVRRVKNITLYGIGSLGATLISPSGTSYNETPINYFYEDWWLFSVTAGGGAKIWFSKKIALRLEGRLLMPITWGGGGFMIGTGGSGFYIGGGSAILQGSLSAGLTIALGN